MAMSDRTNAQPSRDERTVTLSSIRSWIVAAAQDQNVQLLAGLALIAAVAHFANCFNAPYYEADEGTYMSQAWAWAKTGQMAPYYYIYDHVPGAWILLGLWADLVGGFNAFGSAIDTGRVLIGLLHIGSTVFVGIIALKLGKSIGGAAAAGLFFALSPLGIYFQRRILLDNVMVFWLLAAVLCIVVCIEKRRYLWAALAGVLFGLAALSKEPAVVFLFVSLIFLALSGRPWRKGLALAAIAAGVAIVMVSPYFLYALQRNELFPNGGVSLIGSLQWQIQRGVGQGGVLSLNGLSMLVPGWMFRDSLTLYLGLAGVVLTAPLVALRGLSFRAILPGLLAIAYTVFLTSRSEPLELYVIPLLPFLAISIGVSAAGLAHVIRRWRPDVAAYANVPLLLGLLGASAWLLSSGTFNFSADQTSAQRQATEWIRANVPANSFVVIDAYDWVELHDSAFGKTIAGAHYYWKVVDDPAIRDGWLGGDWRRIDYLAVTPQMLADIKGSHLQILEDAYQHSLPVQIFSSTGWGVEIRRVEKTTVSGVWGFEDGQNPDWQIYPPALGVTAADYLKVSKAASHTGNSSLELGLSVGEGTKNAVVNRSYKLAREVTGWVYLPPDAPANVWVLPFVLDSNWKWANGSGVSLKPGQWVQVSWVLDANKVQLPLQAAGFMFGDDSSAYKGPVYLDDIRLSGAQ
ncbi:MAG: glycosyltransferase family 39 protein [Chloroflexi bacterium]|nr:glycosyltransferase family 39 protein [Chloroflexota bacterium]